MIKVIAFDLVGVLVNERDIVLSNEEEKLERKFTNIDSYDPFFEESARFIVKNQVGSTSSIQRKFSIGYNRAGRIMDQLEEAGIIGPAQGSSPRKVLISIKKD